MSHFDSDGARPAIICTLDLHAVFDDDEHVWSVPVVAFDIEGAALVVDPDSGQLVHAEQTALVRVQLGPLDTEDSHHAGDGSDLDSAADGLSGIEVTNHGKEHTNMAVTDPLETAHRHLARSQDFGEPFKPDTAYSLAAAAAAQIALVEELRSLRALLTQLVEHRD